MVRYHHWLSGHKFVPTPGDNGGQRRLVCCSPWGHKESSTSERLNSKYHISAASIWVLLDKANYPVKRHCRNNVADQKRSEQSIQFNKILKQTIGLKLFRYLCRKSTVYLEHWIYGYFREVFSTGPSSVKCLYWWSWWMNALSDLLRLHWYNVGVGCLGIKDTFLVMGSIFQH